LWHGKLLVRQHESDLPLVPGQYLRGSLDQHLARMCCEPKRRPRRRSRHRRIAGWYVGP
jgi:hypothetical protein